MRNFFSDTMQGLIEAIGIEKGENEMMKAKKNAEYLAMLDKSMAEAEAGGFVTKTIETEKDELQERK